MRYARTLVEGYVHIGLLVSGEDPGDDVMPDYRSRTRLTEGHDAWLLSFEGPPHHAQPIEMLVRYETEAEAREQGLRFGSGISELIDAGQWVQVSAVYGRRALREGILFARDPADDERFTSIAADWEFARDAVIEAAKFLPDGADEVPAAAFWTELGMKTRQEAPERFTRARLNSDAAFYQKSLDDLRRSHGDG